MSKPAQRWEIYKDHNLEFRARFIAGNGETVAVLSEGYVDKADLNDAIDVLELAVIERATGNQTPARARLTRIEVDANGNQLV